MLSHLQHLAVRTGNWIFQRSLLSVAAGKLSGPPAGIIPRESLAAGRRFSGPAIVTEYSATTVIPPKFPFHLDRAGNLLITVPAE